MAKNAKPNINAEAAYENAHLVAQDPRYANRRIAF